MLPPVCHSPTQQLPPNSPPPPLLRAPQHIQCTSAINSHPPPPQPPPPPPTPTAHPVTLSSHPRGGFRRRRSRSLSTEFRSGVSMSSADIAADEAVEKAPRRFPPPCWTQEETLALIDVYRERWYALRRGYLRTPDWDAVADAVRSRCPGALKAKTSAQCRHKMEKLRQRYRAEKQRVLSVFPPGGRSFSSWFFFENMEALENGTVPPASVKNAAESADGSRLQPFLDQNMLKLKLKASNTTDSVPESGFYQDFVKLRRFNSAAKIPGVYPSYLNKEEEQHQEESVHQVTQPILKSKEKKSTKTLKNHNIRHEFHQSDAIRSGSILKSFRKLDRNTDSDYISNSGAPKFQSSINYSNIRGSKRGRTGVEEIVASLKALGEGIMKMEQAKMKMAKEMEEMRMKMEIKRNEVVLESQKQIVDAFLKGLVELKTRKKLKSAADHPSGQP